MNSDRPHQILYKLAQGLHGSGGATVSTTGEILTAGISVGIRPELEHTFSKSEAFTNTLWIHKWLLELPDLKQFECYGIWEDPKGLIYLDIVTVFDNDQIDLAMVYAKLHNQRSIYDLERGELIWI